MTSTLEILVPDLLVPADFAPDLLRDLAVPHLAVLAAHAVEAEAEAAHEDTALRPWQAWLLRSVPGGNVAELWASALGAAAAPGQRRWLAEPVHLQIARNHLVLADPAALALSAEESLTLANAARSVLADEGWTLDAITPQRWLLRRAGPLALAGATPECAIGRNAAEAMPTGDEAAVRAWRRTMNEIQMTWHALPLNDAREARGLAPVNALWLSGNGAAAGTLPYTAVRSALPLLANQPAGNSETTLETFDGLIQPTRAEDWSAWRIGLQALDLRLGEILQTLRDGKLTALDLVATGEHSLRRHTLRRGDLWKFWRRGSVADLIATTF